MSHFDRVIIGAGLSGLSLADRWCDHGAMPDDEKVALIDSNYESIKERTFAFWRPKSKNDFRYASLIENRWDRFRITPANSPSGRQTDSLSFSDFVYEKISGVGFYSYVIPKIEADPRFTLLIDTVLDVHETSGQIKIRLKSGQDLTTKEVWSSATVQERKPILQHFLGYEIETDEDVFQSQVADLMDYRTSQCNETRFLYVLPFSARRALVEFTVFSVSLLRDEDYKLALETYLNEQWSLKRYRINRVERGVVPMGLETLPRFAGLKIGTKIHPIGTAAGLIKASTGYSFMRNQVFLDQGAKSKRHGQWRFYIYDRLLLGIIREDGERLSKILPHLFATNAPNQVFRFLGEDTQFFQELKIFYGLPWKPFFKNLVVEYPFFFALALTCLVFPAHHLCVPLIGVLLLGISHGSRDHRLLPQGKLYLFFSKYLLGVAVFLGIWWLSPAAALILFLGLSMEHFGTCQFARALKLSSDQLWPRSLAFLWGAFASLGAPLFHWNEALPILRSILRNPNIFSQLPNSAPLVLGVAAAVLALISAAIFDRYELETTARSRTALWSTALLVMTFAALPLLSGFLVFFAYWHSIDSIRHQKESRQLSWQNYFRQTLPMTALSWVGLAGLFVCFGFNWGVFFVALGAVTLPHAFAMMKFYAVQKKASMTEALKLF